MADPARPAGPGVARPAAAGTPIRVGVSACLLGHRVRWDGGHKADAFLIRLLGRHVEWLPVCPEVEGRLSDPSLRESFVVRVFVYHALQRLFASRFSPAALVAFHSAHCW